MNIQIINKHGGFFVTCMASSMTWRVMRGAATLIIAMYLRAAFAPYEVHHAKGAVVVCVLVCVFSINNMFTV